MRTIAGVKRGISRVRRLPLDESDVALGPRSVMAHNSRGPVAAAELPGRVRRRVRNKSLSPPTGVGLLRSELAGSCKIHTFAIVGTRVWGAGSAAFPERLQNPLKITVVICQAIADNWSAGPSVENRWRTAIRRSFGMFVGMFIRFLHCCCQFTSSQPAFDRRSTGTRPIPCLQGAGD